MTRERYESISLHDLREIAKTRGMRRISTLKKADLIDALLKKDEEDAVILRNERMQRKQMQEASQGTGKEAIEIARKNPPDIFLMDIQMPEMDGIEAQPDQNEKSGLPERTPGKRYL